MKSFFYKVLLHIVAFQCIDFAHSTDSMEDYPVSEMGYKYSESRTNLSKNTGNKWWKFCRKSTASQRNDVAVESMHLFSMKESSDQHRTTSSIVGSDPIADAMSSLSNFARVLKVFSRPTFHRNEIVTLSDIKSSLANTFQIIKRLPIQQISEDDGFDHISSIDCIDALLSEISTQVRNLSNPRINRSDNFVQENTEHNLTLEATVDSILRSLSKIAQKVKDLSS